MRKTPPLKGSALNTLFPGMMATDQGIFIFGRVAQDSVIKRRHPSPKPEALRKGGMSMQATNAENGLSRQIFVLWVVGSKPTPSSMGRYPSPVRSRCACQSLDG